jgi:hypothetical protein
MKFYPKIRPVGHRDIQDLLHGPVVVQEKIDGSNFAFGRTLDGELFCLSRARKLDLSEGAVGQFGPAVKHVLDAAAHKIPNGKLYRCEYLQKPHHNVLAYGRVPKGHLVLFEVEQEIACESYTSIVCDDAQLHSIAEDFGIDAAQQIATLNIGRGGSLNELFEAWSKQESMLGGEIEGVVIKNYHKTDAHGNILIGKMVRKEFKEVHKHKATAEKTDPAYDIGARFGGPARWRKAVQFLRDCDGLQGEMMDMPLLMKRVRQDVELEEKDAIKELLWQHYRKNVLGATTKGLAEWYKGELGLL